MTHRPADNRLPPPPRDKAALVTLVAVVAVLGLGSLAIWAVS